MRALVASALASFSAASYFLNPHWREDFSPARLLASVDWLRHQNTAPIVVPMGAQVQTSFTQCPQFFPSRQAPLVPAGQRLRELCFSTFAVLHNGQTKTPVFVVERLNRQTLKQAQAISRTDRFYAEARLPRAERAELDDYKDSGYSRGHMAPAADMATEQAMAQSFSLANMVPQNQSNNAGAWSRIEQDTRKYAARAAGDVYVFTGPVYSQSPRAIGSGVAVPAYLFKLVYDATTGRAWVHWQENSASAKAGRPISYAEFVRRTGLRLLPAQHLATRPPSMQVAQTPGPKTQ